MTSIKDTLYTKYNSQSDESFLSGSLIIIDCIQSEEQMNNLLGCLITLEIIADSFNIAVVIICTKPVIISERINIYEIVDTKRENTIFFRSQWGYSKFSDVNGDIRETFTECRIRSSKGLPFYPSLPYGISNLIMMERIGECSDCESDHKMKARIKYCDFWTEIEDAFFRVSDDGVKNL